MSLQQKILKIHFFHSLKNRLIFGFLLATCLTGLFATVVGIVIINKSTLTEVQNKVQQDLNTAKLIYNYNLEQISFIVRHTALDPRLPRAIATNTLPSFPDLQRHASSVRRLPHSTDHIYLEMLTVTDSRGRSLFRVFNREKTGDDLSSDPVIKRCLETKSPQFSTQVMSYEKIITENPQLHDRLQIPIIHTPKSVSVRETILTDGLVLRAVYPVFDQAGQLAGTISGGFLLNLDYTIVDRLKDTVYKNETYKGRDLGYSTIFLGPVRISTNVMDKENRRAIGTICSQEVYEKVVGQGKEWIGRAFVVTDWYITAYTPIRDINENIVGILYTGVIETKYRDLQIRAIFIFILVTIVGMCIAFGLSFYFGNAILQRIAILKKAADAIGEGNLDYQLSTDKYSGFGLLDEAFNKMTKSLKDRDERLRTAHRSLAVNERLAALGKMAAGVAHELNNPLGGILLYSDLMLEEMPPGDPRRQYLEKISYQANRSKEIVANLLDFAKRSPNYKTPASINEIILTAFGLLKDQSIFLGLETSLDLASDLPTLVCDKPKLEEVFLNLFMNAADAMNGKGTLGVRTSFKPPSSIVITVSDTGMGIDKNSLPHIFEPFFTTKEPGRGIGLGLSITYGIISAHRGTIEVQSEPGRGTEFTIILPVDAEDKNHSE